MTPGPAAARFVVGPMQPAITAEAVVAHAAYAAEQPGDLAVQVGDRVVVSIYLQAKLPTALPASTIACAHTTPPHCGIHSRCSACCV